MSEPDTIEYTANRAMAAAKAAMGAEDRDVYQMNGTDQGNVTSFAIALVNWEAAKLAAAAAESRRKPSPPTAQS